MIKVSGADRSDRLKGAVFVVFFLLALAHHHIMDLHHVDPLLIHFAPSIIESTCLIGCLQELDTLGKGGLVDGGWSPGLQKITTEMPKTAKKGVEFLEIIK